MAQAIARHDAIVRGSIEGAAGYVFSTAGDSFAAAFARPADAVRATLDAQHGLTGEPWPAPLALRVRMGLHTGDAVERDGDYFLSAALDELKDDMLVALDRADTVGRYDLLAPGRAWLQRALEVGPPEMRGALHR
jgi:hypothetical protein